MLTNFIKFIHVLAGVTGFGVIIAIFFYVSHAVKQKNHTLIAYAIKASFWGDALIALIICVQFYTATYLVKAHQLSTQVPWIKVAYFAFGTIALLCLCSLSIRYANRKRADFRFKSLFYIVNIAIIVLFIAIIHDAVMQHTWLY